MTTDLDERGRNAARALRALVDESIDGATLDLALDRSMGHEPRLMTLHVSEALSHRRRLLALVAVAAAVLVTIFVVNRADHDPIPVRPAPDPTAPATTAAGATTSGATASGPRTATTVPDPVVRHASTLASIGPTLSENDALPYPPDAVALRDGRVLKLVEDFSDKRPIEILDPATGKVRVAGSTLVNRSGPAMVVLADGRVLIAGGDQTPFTTVDGGGSSSSFAKVSTAEVFDPATGKSVSVGRMVAVRVAPLAVRLPDGKVLVVGSFDSPETPATAVAEVFDPKTKAFARTGDRTTKEQPNGIFLMADGRVLVFGKHPEVYDPSTGRFAAATNTVRTEALHPVMLADGRVLAIHGGCPELDSNEALAKVKAVGYSDGRLAARTEFFDPRTGGYTAGPDVPHCVTTATTLPSGQVFLSGYWWALPAVADPQLPNQAIEQTWSGVFDPVTGTTSEALGPNRRDPAAVLTPSGRVILVGGVPLGSSSMSWADVYP